MKEQKRRVTLTVNGHVHDIAAAGDMPLLWVLRDILNLTGTKYGCGRGLCGACTVHLDGRAVRSCQLPLAAVPARSAITTIEGLRSTEFHPVQQAWIDRDVPQCGFCQPGQIMQAASIHNHNEAGGKDDFVRSMSNNLCRCGTHARIIKALADLTKSSNQDDVSRES